MDLQALGRGRRRMLAPERVDQAVTRDDLAPLQEQDREQRPFLSGAQRDHASVIADLEWTEEAIIHNQATLSARPNLPPRARRTAAK